MPKSVLIADESEIIKRKKIKKISALCLMSIAFILVVLIVIAACINVNLKPNFVASPDRIIIYNKTSTYGEFTSGSAVSDDSRYDEFLDLFNESFTTSYLVALFSGRLGGYYIDKSSEVSLKYSDVMTELQEGYYAEFKYTTPQTLTYSNGDIYYSSYASNTPVEYNSLYFALSENDGVKDVNIFVAYKTASSTSSYIIQINNKGNTNLIYQNLSKFKG